MYPSKLSATNMRNYQHTTVDPLKQHTHILVETFVLGFNSIMFNFRLRVLWFHHNDVRHNSDLAAHINSFRSLRCDSAATRPAVHQTTCIPYCGSVLCQWMPLGVFSRYLFFNVLIFVIYVANHRTTCTLYHTPL